MKKERRKQRKRDAAAAEAATMELEEAGSTRQLRLSTKVQTLSSKLGGVPIPTLDLTEGSLELPPTGGPSVTVADMGLTTVTQAVQYPLSSVGASFGPAGGPAEGAFGAVRYGPVRYEYPYGVYPAAQYQQQHYQQQQNFAMVPPRLVMQPAQPQVQPQVQPQAHPQVYRNQSFYEGR